MPYIKAAADTSSAATPATMFTDTVSNAKRSSAGIAAGYAREPDGATAVGRNLLWKHLRRAQRVLGIERLGRRRWRERYCRLRLALSFAWDAGCYPTVRDCGCGLHHHCCFVGLHRRSRCAVRRSDCHPNAGPRLRSGPGPGPSSAAVRPAETCCHHFLQLRQRVGSGCGSDCECGSGSGPRRRSRRPSPNHRSRSQRRPSARCAMRHSRRPWRGQPTALLMQ